MAPKIAHPAPDFKGVAVVDGKFKTIQLSDYVGKYVVLFFYPLDFTFVCPTEIVAFSEAAARFEVFDFLCHHSDAYRSRVAQMKKIVETLGL